MGLPELREVEWQLRKRAGVADELDLSHGERMHAFEVPQEGARGRGHPTPPQDVLDGDFGQRCRRSLQCRTRGGRSVDGQQGKTVKQQVQGTRVTWRRREGLNGAADLQEDVLSSEMSRHLGRAYRGQIGFAR